MRKDLDPESFLTLGKQPFTVLIDFLLYDVLLAELVKRDDALSRFRALRIGITDHETALWDHRRAFFDGMLSLFHRPTGLLAGATFVLTLSQYSKTC